MINKYIDIWKETVNQLILAKSVNIFRRKSSSEQTKQSTDSENFKKSLRCCFDCTCGAAFWSGVRKWCFNSSSSQNYKTKIFGLQLAEWNPGFVGGFFYVSLRIGLGLKKIGMQFAKTHGVDISGIILAPPVPPALSM